MKRGLVQQDPSTERYSCTLKLWEWGVLLSERIEIKDLARPHLVELSKKTQETVHLSVLDGAEVIYIDKIDTPQVVGTYSKIGSRAPAYTMATGKAMLAFLSDAELASICDHLRKMTPRVNIEELRQELLKVREAGYAINRGDARTGACGIASPIFDASRAACAAVGISGPIDRIKPGLIRDFSPIVMDAALHISRALGYSGGFQLAAASNR
jgi:DNA-binding IclR family transcriptional regulator